MPKSFAELRREYALQSLRKKDVRADPFRQFRAWFEQAIQAQILDPTAMTLATATPDGKPSARLVLLKDLDDHGFVFYTNFESRKGHDLQDNPRAALVFHWPELERQVRIEGKVEKVPAEEADAYFRTRPRGSQLGAHASRQSEPVEDRSVLEEGMRRLEKEYADHEIPRPPHWGGYRVLPSRIEFWQGRPNRLHDRIEYMRQTDGSWQIERLSP